jgi:hypothetical protein
MILYTERRSSYGLCSYVNSWKGIKKDLSSPIFFPYLI